LPTEWFFPLGMAASNAVVEALLKGGDEIVAAKVVRERANLFG